MPKLGTKKPCKGHTVEVGWLKKPRELIRQGEPLGGDFLPAARAAGDAMVSGVDQVTLCDLTGLMEIRTSNGDCVLARVEQVTLPWTPDYVRDAPGPVYMRRVKRVGERCLEHGVSGCLLGCADGRPKEDQ